MFCRQIITHGAVFVKRGGFRGNTLPIDGSICYTGKTACRIEFSFGSSPVDAIKKTPFGVFWWSQQDSPHFASLLHPQDALGAMLHRCERYAIRAKQPVISSFLLVRVLLTQKKDAFRRLLVVATGLSPIAPRCFIRRMRSAQCSIDGSICSFRDTKKDAFSSVFWWSQQDSNL